MAHPDLRYPINLLDDGYVVTKDGEYLGTWTSGEHGGIYDFSPDRVNTPTMFHPFMLMLCDQIEEWRLKQRSEAIRSPSVRAGSDKSKAPPKRRLSAIWVTP